MKNWIAILICGGGILLLFQTVDILLTFLREQKSVDWQLIIYHFIGVVSLIGFSYLVEAASIYIKKNKDV